MNFKKISLILDRDHASLFFMSTLLYTIDPEGDKITMHAKEPEKIAKMNEYFPSYDIHRGWSTPHRASATNIYKTKDGRFFHLHGQPSIRFEGGGANLR